MTDTELRRWRHLIFRWEVVNTSTRASLGRFFFLRNAVWCQQDAARRDRRALYVIRNSAWPNAYLTFTRLTRLRLR